MRWVIMNSTKEDTVASVKQEQQENHQTLISTEPVCEVKLDPADFELDEQLRTLRLDEWFAMVEEGTPIWFC
jgi:hypothetical protein